MAETVGSASAMAVHQAAGARMAMEVMGAAARVAEEMAEGAMVVLEKEAAMATVEAAMATVEAVTVAALLEEGGVATQVGAVQRRTNSSETCPAGIGFDLPVGSCTG